MEKRIFLICVLLFILTFSLYIFPIRVCHTWDETVYLQNAETLFSGRTNYNEFLFRPPLISLIFFLTFYISHSVISATIVITLISSLAPVFVFLSVRKIYSFRIGLIAALLLALSPFVMLNSHFLLTDVPAISLISISFYYMIKNKEGNSLIAGVFYSLTVLMKFTYILFALVFLIYWILFKIKFRTIIKTIIGISLIMIPYLIWAFISYGSPIEPFVKGIAVVSDLNEGFLYYILNLHEAFNLVVLIGFVIWLFYFLFNIKKNIKESRFDVLLLAWLFIFIVFLSITSHKELRYIFPIAVPLVILASKGIDNLINKIKNKKIIIFIYILLIIIASIHLTDLQKNPDKISQVYDYIKNVVYDNSKSEEMLIAEYIKENLSNTELIYVRHQWPVIAYYSNKKIEVMPAEFEDYYKQFSSKIKENQIIVASEFDTGYFYPNIPWLDSVKQVKFIKKIGSMRIYSYYKNN